MTNRQSILPAIVQRTRSRWVHALIAPVLAVSFLAVWANERDDDKSNEPYAVGLWGDLPYSPAQATVGVPNLIADMNAQRLKFTVHNGDLKAGSGSPCDDALYAQSLAFFNTLSAPAMFTPGDNDWTDCDRPANGGFNSLERLDKERAVFFSTPYSMGQKQLFQEVQQGALCLGALPAPCLASRTAAGRSAA